MKDPNTLRQALRSMAGELHTQQPPPAVWAHVRADFERRHAAAPKRWRWPLAGSGAAASLAVLAGSALLMLRPVPGPSDAMQGAGFLPVASVERWADARRDGPAWVVSAELPNERLAELGLPYDPARAGERVRAELLLHPAGDVLAVRLLR